MAALHMERIVCLHGVPKKIVSDRGTQFTSHFWQQVHSSLGTKLNFSTTYHPQTDGQNERINQISEDMLRLVHCSMVQVGTRVFLMQSFHITTVTRRVSIWHLLKLCMDKSVEPHCFRIKREKLKCSDQMF